MKHTSLRTLVTTAVLVTALPLAALAWTSAPGTPPTPNIDQPINVGSTAQSKDNYVLFNTGDHTYGLLVYGSGPAQGLVGIGTQTPQSKLQVGADGDGSAVRASVFLYSSDASLKKNITTLPDALSKVLKLRGVSFNWKSTGAADVGLVAQEVEKVYPQVVSTAANGIKAVDYGHLIGPLVEAVKAQQTQIDALKAEVAALKAKVK